MRDDKLTQAFYCLSALHRVCQLILSFHSKLIRWIIRYFIIVKGDLPRIREGSGTSATLKIMVCPWKTWLSRVISFF